MQMAMAATRRLGRPHPLRVFLVGLVALSNFAAPAPSRADEAVPIGGGDTAEAALPFSAGVVVATVVGGAITEASGLAVSRKNAGVLWVHNDSGEKPRIFAIGMDGKLIATYRLPGVSAEDYEDMAIGRGPRLGVDYLYVADIGDNLATRSSVVVFRVREPDTTGASGEIDLLDGVAALELRYPDHPYDAQTLMADPLTGDLFLITRDVGGESRVFRAPFPQSASAPTTLEQVARINFSGTGPSDLAVTAGDIGAFGKLIVVRTYNQALLWERARGESVAEALAGVPVPTPVVGSPTEPQGEAIAFGPEAKSYFTLSEGIEQPLHRFDRR